MDQTTNYKLSKPGYSDGADIAVLNQNMDKIDTQMKANATAISTLQTGKVEKINGKDLSTNDYTAAEKSAVANATSNITALQTSKADLVDGKVPNSQLPATGIPIVTTTGTGSGYKVTVAGITSLTKGMMITIIPHTTSTSTTPTLTVNSFAGAPIKRRSSAGNGAVPEPSTTWMSAGTPQTVQYDGSYWISVSNTKPDAADLEGTTPVVNGGTGKSSWTENGILYAYTKTSFSQLPPASMNGMFLRQNGSNRPFWGQASDIYIKTVGTDWTGTGPFYQEITISGIDSNTTPIIDVLLTGTKDTDKNILRAWSLIDRIVTGYDRITLTCYDGVPEVSFPIQLKVV